MTLIGTLVEGGRTYRLLDDDLSGYCSQLKRHDLCAHRPGGPQEHGVYSLADPALGIPAYTWRCGCACHHGELPGQQLDLFGLGAAS